MPRYLVAHSDGQTDAAPLLGAFWERLTATADVMATAFPDAATIEWSIVEASGLNTALLARLTDGHRYTSADRRNTVIMSGQWNGPASVEFMRCITAARPYRDDYDE